MVLLILTTEGGNQVFKIPVLFSHFQLHIKEGRSSSWGDFLSEHYRSHHHKDNDSAEDEKLPFRSINPESFSTVYAASTQNAIVALHADLKETDNSTQVSFSFQNHLSDVFHPPKIYC